MLFHSPVGACGTFDTSKVAAGVAVAVAPDEAENEGVAVGLAAGDAEGYALDVAPTHPATANNMAAETAAHVRRPRELANIDTVVALLYANAKRRDAAVEPGVTAGRPSSTAGGTRQRLARSESGKVTDDTEQAYAPTVGGPSDLAGLRRKSTPLRWLVPCSGFPLQALGRTPHQLAERCGGLVPAFHAHALTSAECRAEPDKRFGAGDGSRTRDIQLGRIRPPAAISAQTYS
jgi:hypothetical protein